MSGTRDESTFRHLYVDTYAELLRFVQRRVEPPRAEDVVAEVFTVAWRRIDDLPADPSDARAWVFGIARNTLLNEWRSATRTTALSVRLARQADTQHPSAAEPDPAEDVVALVDLRRAWSRLTEAHRETLALTAWDGLTSGEAAQVLGISPVAYRLRLSRARRALRAHLHAGRGSVPRDADPAAPPRPSTAAATTGGEPSSDRSST